MVKKLKYKVVVKGVTISRHVKKTTAVLKAGRIRGAIVLPIKKKTTRKRVSKKRSYRKRR